MKAQAKITKCEDVELSDQEARRIADAAIRSAFQLPPRAYIREDGKLMSIWEESGGSHSWDESEPVRDATDGDRAALIVLRGLGRAKDLK